MSYVYIGEVKEGTEVADGIGIQVRSDGYTLRLNLQCIEEGYWKEGKLHGKGRYIFTFKYQMLILNLIF